MIAALYVETGGIYFNRPDVDPWDETRDARNYAGPFPVVAHPPCQRWGRYWSGGPSAKFRRELGDDDGCFARALSCVREFGGVLEHPEASHAWRFYGINRPPRGGGWVDAGDGKGYTCCVEQGHYGHAARKATWLYAVDVELVALKWGPCHGKMRLDEGFHSAGERKATRSKDNPIERLSKKQRIGTPPEFAELLISMAKSCNGREAR